MGALKIIFIISVIVVMLQSQGGESDSGLTYIKDLAEGKYHLPWEDDMDIKDGTIYGYPTTGGRLVLNLHLIPTESMNIKELIIIQKNKLTKLL